jgi:ABC-type uncharacterized transport system permease subunit
MEAFDILLQSTFWVAAIRIASPLIFATMGELICERAGVLNLGIEGIMVAAPLPAGSPSIPAAICGPASSSPRWWARLFGLLHSFLTVPLGLSQHVVGIGVTMLATSLAYFTYRLACRK